MTVEELMEKDSGFRPEEFLVNANLMIKKIYNAITLQELSSIAHFMVPELLEEFQKMLKDNENLGVRLFFTEVNVNPKIQSITEDEEYYYITVDCLSKYIMFKMSLSDNRVVEGDNHHRREFSKRIVFRKEKNASIIGDVARCLGCGGTLNIHQNGKCPNCGRIFDLYRYYYVIQKMDL